MASTSDPHVVKNVSGIAAKVSHGRFFEILLSSLILPNGITWLIGTSVYYS